MTSLHLRVVLLEDVVMSRTSATLGAHRTLRHLPGAALLGVAANAPSGGGNLYAALDPADRWRAFHGGGVRFGNALPEGAGGAAVPMPLSFHVAKGQEPAMALPTGRVVDAGRVRNLARLSRADAFGGEQAEQLRDGFVDGALGLVEVATTFRLGTAMDADGRARDGFLHGTEAIRAGQAFLARVDADDGALLDRLRAALLGERLLGRARSAGYGRVRVEETPGAPPPLPTGRARSVTLLCLSDLVLRDAATGAPRLLPEARDLGLPEGWTLRLDRSFLRVERYSPFNGRRRRPDLERQAIAAGSVLVFEGSAEVDLAGLAGRLAPGVGEGRNEGLGQVLVEPPLLAADRPVATVGPRPAPIATAPPPTPDDATFRWLLARHEAVDREDRALQLARDWLAPMRRFKVPRAQWGEVRRLAVEVAGGPEPTVRFLARFDEFANKGVGKLSGRWGTERQGRTAAARLRELVEEAARGEAGEVAVLAVARLAALAPRPEPQEVR